MKTEASEVEKTEEIMIPLTGTVSFFLVVGVVITAITSAVCIECVISNYIF